MDDGTRAKRAVRTYWEAQACGTEWARSQKFSRTYFDEIERFRYASETCILPFAQFDETRGRRVLEVGVGAGTDFLQFVRAGAHAYGVDMTHEAVTHVQKRLAVYDLGTPNVAQADCETLPYRDDVFDLVYSWGVIHHTPNTLRALEEIVRVCQPGGTCKLMIYNRHSLLAAFLWVRWALLHGSPGMQVSEVLASHMESQGTKAFTEREVRDILTPLAVTDLRIQCHLSRDDRLDSVGHPIVRQLARFTAWMFGPGRGWFMTIQFCKRSTAAPNTP